MFQPVLRERPLATFGSHRDVRASVLDTLGNRLVTIIMFMTRVHVTFGFSISENVLQLHSQGTNIGLARTGLSKMNNYVLIRLQNCLGAN